jgi:predicted AlkP superfamily phosphohydrolase/phosphomutase
MRSLIIGLDAFDPIIFERLYEQGQMANLGKWVKTGGYSKFAVSNPPQSEVSWTCIATGANPGVHGVFDFVHRDPRNYALNISLLPTKIDLLGTQFVSPFTSRTIFEQATRKGFPATALWWPATFPARPEIPVRTIPGLGTPDIQGRLGVGTLFTRDSGLEQERFKTAIEIFENGGSSNFRGALKGPSQNKGNRIQEITLDFTLEITDERTARLKIDDYDIQLEKGRWSPILELTFKVSFLFSVRVITRVILNQTLPDPLLYFLPLQIHPLKSPWRYGAPQSFVKETWMSTGPFLTLGWPQDTTGLEEGWIDDHQFLELCNSIVEGRERVLKHHLGSFDEGVLAIVFDSLDRVQHMFLRDRPDLIDSWYRKLDALVGRIETYLQSANRQKTRIMVVSDHGFAPFNYKVHLNQWLIEHGNLHPIDSGEKKKLHNVDWSMSQAYAVGLNSLYLNLQGREGQGSVGPDQKENLRNRLREDLLAWLGPDGRNVIQNVYFQEEAFYGPLATYAPDILIGYAPGYRASADTGLGSWKEVTLEPNHDHWGADHCIDPLAVPGIIFSNENLQNFLHPSYLDIPRLTIGEDLEHKNVTPPPPSSNKEDQEILEKRLKSLGYL